MKWSSSASRWELSHFLLMGGEAVRVESFDGGSLARSPVHTCSHQQEEAIIRQLVLRQELEQVGGMENG